MKLIWISEHSFGYLCIKCYLPICCSRSRCDSLCFWGGLRLALDCHRLGLLWMLYGSLLIHSRLHSVLGTSQSSLHRLWQPLGKSSLVSSHTLFGFFRYSHRHAWAYIALLNGRPSIRYGGFLWHGLFLDWTLMKIVGRHWSTRLFRGLSRTIPRGLGTSKLCWWPWFGSRLHGSWNCFSLQLHGW